MSQWNPISTAHALLRVFAWAAAVGFLADVVRRCWIVEAWTIFPIAIGVLGLSLRRLRAAWRAARRNPNADFLRIR